ncbi:MAG: hypothetical protein CVT62_03220 [Actinobacteria bacterium HGW-Actinobacteria-2]|nr:MAG: hypothetical protein CVT62_03220 [Actinobacteria bacterium HGW-Actinobacteria-2]
MAAQTPSAEPPRSRAEIEADIAAARDRLAENLAGLINQVHPKAIVRNTVADARDFVDSGYHKVKDQLVNEKGVRIERVALVLAAAAGAVTFAVVLRSIFRDR